ncbi:CehA/McbA family metallohydrolase [Planctellipticum variicoloris]|uniref:CehA/McbA family metallohydrolase n=1 Tax=Planctellipticum variicoloris TaxID=3064265 RepID=UPI0030140F2C|nr:CehA/McbA family metallohydrolase [Planctomycetaceae bacterium SH412]
MPGSLRVVVVGLLFLGTASAREISLRDVDAQPLGSQIRRLIETFESLGTPFDDAVIEELRMAMREGNASRLQTILDPHVAAVGTVVASGPALRAENHAVSLQQHGYVPVLIKVLNPAESTGRWEVQSPQAGLAFRGQADLSMVRQQQEQFKDDKQTPDVAGRFLHLEPYGQPPQIRNLSGLAVEYVVLLMAADTPGRHPIVLRWGVADDDGQVRRWAETELTVNVQPAHVVRLQVRDERNLPSTARLTIRDARGRVYPPQARRVAPDLFFEPQIYRHDGETVLLPPGQYVVESGRGPEYVRQSQELAVPADGEAQWSFALVRWVDPAAAGFFGGDHHIHAAGCSHYTSPTEGVTPADMFRQVKGEGLNVGCVLTWGPCFDVQRRFFGPVVHGLSEPQTVLKYDLEISGFGSQALGHVCLLNLQNQEYPGSDGTATKGWPTWTTPVMRWAKEQGGVTGYAHSASGLAINPANEAQRLVRVRDRNGDQSLSVEEASVGVLSEDVAKVDADGDGRLSVAELERSLTRASLELPNYAIPEMNGVGAMEICVAASEGVCDFISAMDTERIQEWNTWYHLLNCGFPLKVSGETDFPCMSSLQVGQGRVYVHLGAAERIDFADWCRGLAEGRSYVSDGYAHALQFHVGGQSPGPEPVRLNEPGTIPVRATVTFAAETPIGVAHGTSEASAGRRVAGDTRILHAARENGMVRGGQRTVDLVVNGVARKSWEVPADGRSHDLAFELPIDGSCWVALRSFPQLHTNPVTVLVKDEPVRASRRSAQWCAEMTEVLWQNRERAIAPAEREAAREAFERTIRRFRGLAEESPGGS